MITIENKKIFNNFLRRTTLIAAMLLIIDLVLKLWLPELPQSSVRPWLIVFFLLVTNLVFFLQLRAVSARGSRFVNTFMVTTGFKLLFFLAIIIIYALLVREDAVRFIVDFFILYVIFTTMEIFSIRKIQSHQRKE